MKPFASCQLGTLELQGTLEIGREGAEDGTASFAGTGVYYFAYLRHQGTKDPSVVAGTADLAGDPAAAAAQGDKYKSEAPSKKMLNAAGMAGGQDTGKRHPHAHAP